MEDTIKTSDVTDFIKFTISSFTSDKYKVDKDGYILGLDGKKIEMEDSNILLYTDVVKDSNVHVLNPFTEGISQRDKITSFYYSLIYNSFSAKIITVLKNVSIRCALEQAYSQIKDAKKKEKFMEENPGLALDLPSSLSNLIKKVHKYSNKDTNKDFDTLTNAMSKERVKKALVYFLYSKKSLASYPVVELLEDDYEFPTQVKSQFPKFIKECLLNMFDVKDYDALKNKYKVKAHEDSSSPKLDSHFRSIYKIAYQMNDYFDDVSNDLDIAFDMNEFRTHIEKLVGYSMNARSAVYSNPKPKSNSLSTIPSAQSFVPANSGGSTLTLPDGTPIQENQFASPIGFYGNNTSIMAPPYAQNISNTAPNPLSFAPQPSQPLFNPAFTHSLNNTILTF